MLNLGKQKIIIIINLNFTTHQYPNLYPDPRGFTTIPIICFTLLISITFLCEFECFSLEKVGLLAGRYSGASLPDLYLTPQALQRVFGPRGPALHCGVFSDPQCWHFLPIVAVVVVIAASTLTMALAFLLLVKLHHCCLPGTSAKPARRRLQRRLLRARRGALRLPHELMRMLLPLGLWPLLLLLLLVVLLSSTETGLWCFGTPTGWSERMPTNVSTAGNKSLFDIHSSSSSANSCITKKRDMSWLSNSKPSSQLTRRVAHFIFFMNLLPGALWFGHLRGHFGLFQGVQFYIQNFKY